MSFCERHYEILVDAKNIWEDKDRMCVLYNGDKDKLLDEVANEIGRPGCGGVVQRAFGVLDDNPDFVSFNQEMGKVFDAAAQKLRVELEWARAEVSDVLKEGWEDEEAMLGYCYQESGSFATLTDDLINPTVVHGKIKSGRNFIAHAWVVFNNGLVYDGALRRFYKKHLYYQTLACETHHEYSAGDYAWISAIFSHHGPFTDKERTEFERKKLGFPNG